jgi:hypothetical protein
MRAYTDFVVSVEQEIHFWITWYQEAGEVKKHGKKFFLPLTLYGLQPFGPWSLFQSVGILDRGSARRKDTTYTQNINTEYTHIDIHAGSGIRTTTPVLERATIIGFEGSVRWNYLCTNYALRHEKILGGLVYSSTFSSPRH